MKGSSIEVTTSDRIKRKYSGEKMMMVDREKSRLLHAGIKARIARLQAEIKRLEKKMSKETYRKHTIVGHAGYGFDGIEAYRFENGLEISESYGFVGGLTYLYSLSPASEKTFRPHSKANSITKLDSGNPCFAFKAPQ
jgi:uncharacterized small protein (DUF1192 family)